MFRRSIARTLLPAAVAAGLLGSYSLAQPATLATGAAPPPPKEKRLAPLGAALPIDYPAIVERYGRAVVNISAASDKQTSPPAPEAVDSDDPFAAFFKRVVPQQPESPSNAPRAIAGSGSGFIVTPDGLIVTAAHVVDQAAEVIVTLTDRRKFKATVLTVDTESGVALLQIDATKLPTVKLGDSSRVRVGEPVLTIGSLDSFANTVTDGIISATPRALPDGSRFPFFQTDVAANPDNSGGPLFNHAGEVIGIDVQIYTNAEPYQSLTFAIPINLVNTVRMQWQAQRGDGASGGLGVDVQDVAPGLAAALGLPRPAGALVNAVAPGTPAAASGLKAGDVVTQIGEKAIDGSADLVDYASGMQAGTKTVVRVIRDRRPMTVRLMAGSGGGGLAAGRISQAKQSPEAKQAPVAEPVAEMKQVPAVGPVQEVKQVPAAQPVPKVKQVPDAQPVQEVKQVPDAQPITEAKQVPAVEPVLDAKQVPAVEPVPEAKQVPAADPVQEVKQVPAVESVQEAKQVPAAEPLPQAKPIPAAARVPTAQPIPAAGQNAAVAADRLGLSMHALSEDEKRASDLPLGLMVDEVTGPAARAGIQPGDIVLSFNGELLESQDDASALEAKAKKPIAVLIQRHNVRRFVSIEAR
ncbi:trypsin-like peptidase domain-containing protein [Trinickia sp. YCB016]